MIYVKLNDESYSYDIHSLIKAFYPDESVRVVPYGEDIHSGDGAPEFSVYAGPAKITVTESVSDRVLCDYETNAKYKDDRAEYKSELKRRLYTAISEYTGKTLPWGTLTGIRPTKLAMGYLDESMDHDTAVRMYEEKYLASNEKARLAVDIAAREKSVLDSFDDPYEGYSLYIGIPFCPSRCLYCSFMSYPIATNKKAVGPYLDAVMKETDEVARIFAGRRLDSIYIGGGTPTTLTSEELKRLICHIQDTYDLSSIREFTVEAGRADSIDKDKLKVLKELGADRISVNPQTLNEDTLKLIGRKATAAETVAAYHLAREVGFDNINMDLILGLPGETTDDIRRTLEGVAELRPDDLTVHALAVKRGSKLAEMLLDGNRQKGERASADIDLYNGLIDHEKAMRLTSDMASSIGLKPYYLYRQKNISGNLENTGFAAKGKEGIYNILMMEEVQDIVACGAGTVSKRVLRQSDGNIRIDRCDTHKDLKLYLENTDEMIMRKIRLYSSSPFSSSLNTGDS